MKTIAAAVVTLLLLLEIWQVNATCKKVLGDDLVRGPIPRMKKYKKNDVVTYECKNAGYRIGGQNNNTKTTATITCRGRRWSAPPPFCEPIRCGPPEDGIETRKVPENIEIAAGNSFTYECNCGYTAPAASLMTVCQDDGSWSQPPPNCTLEGCPDPANVNNTLPVVPGPTYVYGDSYTYTCIEGHQLKNGSNLTITCRADGTWSAPPQCEVEGCPDPANVNNTLPVVPGPTYVYGDSYTYTCIEGHQLKDGSNLTITCRADGTWSAPPQCEGPCTSMDTRDLNEYWRRDNNGSDITPLPGNNYNCDRDSLTTSVWFRLTGLAGDVILNTCPPILSCGTHAGMWTNATMPADVGQLSTVPIYASWSFRGCATWSYTISVQKCSQLEGDYIYKFNEVITCRLSVCGMYQP